MPTASLVPPRALAAADALKVLAAGSSSQHERKRAADALSDLAAPGNSAEPEAQTFIVSAGGVELLVPQVSACESHAAASAAYALGSLALENTRVQTTIATVGGILPLVGLLHLGNAPNGRPTQLQGAAWAIGNIGAGHACNAAAIDAAGGVAALVASLQCLARAGVSTTTQILQGASWRARWAISRGRMRQCKRRFDELTLLYCCKTSQARAD